MAKLTKAEKAEARLAFAEGKACEHCGALHQRACFRVKRVEKLGNGNVTVTEFWRRWEQPDAIWPDEAFDPEDAEDAGGR